MRRNRERVRKGALPLLVRAPPVFLMSLAGLLLLTAVSAAAIGMTADPPALVRVAAVAVLAFGAVLCGAVSRRLCPDAPFLAALIASAEVSALFLIYAAVSRSLGPASISAYAAFMLLALLVSAVKLPRTRGRRRKL